MPEPSLHDRDTFSIVPGEDELLARPRSGYRPPAKAVAWPAVLLSLIAVLGVAALAAVYWHERQGLLESAQRSAEVATQRQHDAEQLDTMRQRLDELSTMLEENRRELAALPEFEPQRLSALETRVDALSLVSAQLSGLTTSDQQRSELVASLTQSMDALDQSDRALDARLSAIESRLDGFAARVAGLERELNEAR
ncbi:hypothetical protein [Halotalea alkalilenta]|uniref:Uncharacterized protein n=1 Tax=Halotalea alkalilenta TaxID=376489 RepID=A0A172YGP7_9GAMM|nr:hypothetical protein [Halotalea alkalilenta]ANF58222.1 hypothetical protein A5892_12715 [Halotalea alkalilenta]